MADLQEALGNIPVGSILGFFLALGTVTLISYFGYKGAKALLLRYTSRSSARWVARGSSDT